MKAIEIDPLDKNDSPNKPGFERIPFQRDRDRTIQRLSERTNVTAN